MHAGGRRFYQEREGTTGRGGPAVAALRLPPRPPELRRRVEDAPLPDKQWFVYDSEGKRFGAYMGKDVANNTLQNQTEKTEIDPAIDAVADGYALTADTIEELAALMEVPSGEFGSIWAAKYQAAVTSPNAWCSAASPGAMPLR